MRDSSVLGGTPSASAAPLVAVHPAAARRQRLFDLLALVGGTGARGRATARSRGWEARNRRGRARSRERGSPRARRRSAARGCCPGHGYAQSAAMADSSIPRIALPTLRAYWLAQYSARSGMSSARSRSGGTRIGNTLSRKKRSERNFPSRTASSRSRLVAATTRASVRSVSLPPTRSNSRSWSTRSSATWTGGGSSPTSSRKIVPPAASSKRPRRRSRAPVKAPFSWPNSSDATSPSGQRGAVDLDQGALRPGRPGVDRAGDELLAGPGLARDQHGRVGRRHATRPAPAPRAARRRPR